MKKWAFLLGSILATLVGGLLLVPSAGEAGDPSVRQHSHYQYAAKVLCTFRLAIPTAGEDTNVLPGSYLTAVNIHNPSDQTIHLRKKVALTVPAPGRQEPGEVSKFLEDTLAPDEALSVNCDQIPTAFGIPQPIDTGVEGFLVIDSPRSLDVSAVYTAGTFSDGVESIAVEQIPERRVQPPTP